MTDRVPGGRQRFTNGDVSIKENNDKTLTRTLPREKSLNSLEKNDQESITTYTIKPKSNSTLKRIVKNLLIKSKILNDNSKSKTLNQKHKTKQQLTSEFNLSFNCNAGKIGIANHGNTCYMNAVLQNLSHTLELSRFFVSGKYKDDCKRRPFSHDLSDAFAYLLHSLWANRYKPEISGEFKQIVGKKATQYNGSEQHDAHEFLLWLLNNIHDEINVAKRSQLNKFINDKKTLASNDEKSAAEAQCNQMRYNKSFIHDLFLAFYRSSITCPNCKKCSNTYDPFLSLSLPLPHPSRRPIFVIVVFLADQKLVRHQLRIGLLMESDETVGQLRRTIAKDTKIDFNQIVLTEIYYDGFHRTLTDELSLNVIHEADTIYAIHTPITNNVDADLLLLVTTSIGGRRFGPPVAVRIDRLIDWKSLCDKLANLVLTNQIPSKIFLITNNGSMELNNVQHPLLVAEIERQINEYIPNSGPLHIKLSVEWLGTIDSGYPRQLIEEHESVEQVQLLHGIKPICTLSDCLDLYTKDERLDDDTWICPACSRRPWHATKALEFWSTPEVVVIHLKRFRQISSANEQATRRAKVDLLVKFPINDFDLSPYVCKNSTPQQLFSSWRPHSTNEQNNFIYDLIGVVNHYGNMLGGHYTAVCKSPDNSWHVYDDNKVTPIRQEDIVQEAAYLLFYKRRSISTNDYNWIPTSPKTPTSPIRMQKPIGVSRSQEILISTDSRRNIDAYATMRIPPKQNQKKFYHQTIRTPPPPPPPIVKEMPRDSSAPEPLSSISILDTTTFSKRIFNDANHSVNQTFILQESSV